MFGQLCFGHLYAFGVRVALSLRVHDPELSYILCETLLLLL